MKVYMFKWVGRIENLPEWFKNQEIADVSLEQIKELYDTGNNIMLRHWKHPDSDEPIMMLAVDNGRFNQR